MLSGKVFSTCSVKAVKQGEHSGWAVVLTDIVIAGLYILPTSISREKLPFHGGGGTIGLGYIV